MVNFYIALLFFCMVLAGVFYKDSMSYALISNVGTHHTDVVNIKSAQSDINSIPVKLLSASCGDGNYDDCIALSSIYIENSKDILNLATKALITPCNNHYKEACKMLSKIYSNDIKVKSSRQSYIRYSNKACKLGDAYSCYDLGMQYHKGNSSYIPVDNSKALLLFDKACKAGKLEACDSIATIYIEGGLGISKNIKLAKSLFKINCNLGYEPSCSKISKIK